MYLPLSVLEAHSTPKGSSDASQGSTMGHTPLGHHLVFIIGRVGTPRNVGRLFTGCPRLPTREKSQEYPWNLD
jgi:hypothetical protein